MSLQTDFFGSDAVRTALERAHQAAGMPLSVHYYPGSSGESPRLVGFGQCAACRLVSKTPGGRAACQASRETAARAALRRRKPMPFVCHMGFGCLAIPAPPDAALACTLTLGPYCPAEAPQALEFAVRGGWEQLTGRPEEHAPDIPLGDIRTVPAEGVTALAEWTADTLAQLWRSHEAERSADAAARPCAESAAALDDAQRAAQTPVQRAPRAPSSAAPAEPYSATVIAAALLAGDFRRVRQAVRNETALTADARTPAKVQTAIAHAAGLCAAVLERLASAGVDTAEAQTRFNELPGALAGLDAVRGTKEAAALCTTAVMAVFAPFRPGTKHPPPLRPAHARLHGAVTRRLPGPVRLNEVAAELGEHPTAITHRLQRRLGISFSGYVARLRVEQAKALLQQSGLSMREVAHRVGVDDPSNFARMFRRVTGESLARYQKRLGRRRRRP